MQQTQYKVFLCAQHWKAVQTMYSKGTKYSVKNHLQITHNGKLAGAMQASLYLFQMIISRISSFPVTLLD
jgi:hypothetical protein